MLPSDGYQATRIKVALMARGYKQTDVAAACGVLPTTVSQVIHGRSRSERIERKIAEVTGHDLAELWPQWHGTDAKRRARITQADRVARAKSLAEFLQTAAA